MHPFLRFAPILPPLAVLLMTVSRPFAVHAVFAAPPVAPGAPVRRNLPSGLRLTVVERPSSALVALHLRVRAGSADEAPDARGAAHAVEHLVFLGGAGRAPGAIDSAMESLGGEIVARTFRDSTEFSVTVPAANWRDALALLSELTLRPTLTSDAWETEKPVIRAEIALLHTDILKSALASAGAAFTPDDPYRMPPAGLADEIDKRTITELRTFHDAHYVPSQMTLAMVGAVSAGDIEDAARAFFDGPAARPIERAVRAAQSPLPAVDHLPADPALAQRSLSTVALVWPTPPAADAGSSATLFVLAQLLSDSGAGGRLGSDLIVARKESLLLDAEYLPQRMGGLFLIHSTADHAHAASHQEALLAAVRRVAEDGFSDSELDSARRAALARIAGEEATVDGAARRLALYDSLDTPGLDDELKRQIARITPEQARAALRKTLAQSRQTIIPLGPSVAGESEAKP